MKKSMPLLVLPACLSFLFVFISQWQAEQGLNTAWQTEEYSHGMLIPFIAILIAVNRLAIIKPILRPSWLGIPILLLGEISGIFGQLAASNTLAQLAIIVSILGICISCLGKVTTRVILPTIIYLIFCVPLPHLVQANLSQDLQLLSSTLGVAILDLFGIPVFQQGNIIDLGKFQLQVVEACSGLRYLFPLMSFGYLIAFLLQDRMWKRLVIFLSTIPITIGLNSIRIAFIGITVDLWGPEMAKGFLHSFEGWSIFLICIAILMFEVWILSHIGRRGGLRYEYLGVPRGTLFATVEKDIGPEITALIITGLFTILFSCKFIEQRTEIIPAHAPLSSFPLSIENWKGKSSALEPDVLQFLQLSDYWLADYLPEGNAASVNLYIAYYASQRANTNIHSPSNCIPGGGWQIDSSRTETIQIPSKGPLELTRLIIRRGDTAELVYYWLDERGRDLTENYYAKWYLFWDSITMHRSDGALIRLVTPIEKGEDEQAAASRLNGFIAAVMPEIRAYIPGAPKD